MTHSPDLEALARRVLGDRYGELNDLIEDELDTRWERTRDAATEDPTGDTA